MLIRSGRNCHRYIRFQNNRIVTFITHEKDPSWLSGLGKGLLYSMAALLSVCSLWGCLPAFAELPTGYTTASGSATFQNNGTTLNIHASNKAIINYSTFNIGAKNTVNILSPLSLHRVAAGNPSQILGSLNASGKVFLVNPSGIFFGAGSQVNVQGLVASTLDIKNEDFLAGNYVFQRSANQAPAAIVNQGNIQATESIAMLSGAVENAGSITAPQVHIAVGDRMTYHVGPELAIDVTVNESLKQKVENYHKAIHNSGSITAEQVKLQAKLAQAFYETTVNNTGVIKATGFTRGAEGVIIAQAHSADSKANLSNSGQLLANGNEHQAQGGQIYLESDLTTNSGLIQATSTADSGTGGTVSMLGNTVMNLSGSRIDVSGQDGGGTALIGGDYQGKNAEIRNAQFNYLAQDASITANASQHGNGGKVILWADQKTLFHGTIEAKGGNQGGNGGFVETSGKNILQALGTVDASAANGQAGRWLLDPNDITIQNAGVDTHISSSGGNPDVFTSTDDSAIVTTGSINTALNAGTDVTIQTAAAGADTEGGDITLSSATISKTAGGEATLNLKAHRSILTTGTNSITSSSNKLNVILNADTDQGSDAGVGGAIALTNTTITSNGGNITLGGGADPTANAAKGTSTHIRGIALDNSTLNSGAGNILLRGQGASGAINESHGVFLNNGSTVQSTTGDISAYGKAGAGIDFNRGVQLNNSQITTQDGAILADGSSDGIVWYNYGVSLDTGGKINSTGNGTIHVKGVSNASGVGGYGTGVNLEGSGAAINSLNGDITIEGTGAGPGTVGHGVRLYLGGQINSTGTAKIDITGTGTPDGTNDNPGVSVYGSTSQITSVNGDITLQGTGGGTGSSNHGVIVESGGQINSTGTAKINVTGQGSATGTSNNHGIYLADTNFSGISGSITSADGDITIQGTGGGSSYDNYGVAIAHGSKISSTGTAKINITGQGSTSGIFGSNMGIRIYGSNWWSGISSQITSADGDITIQGTGGGSSYDNYGVLLDNGGKISSTGTAKINVTGQGSTTGSHNNLGLSVSGTNSQITSANGDMTIQGTGGGSGSSNYGVLLANGGQISSTGAAKIIVTGQGSISGTSYYNRGLSVSGTNSQITSANGDITVDGTGGGSGSDNSGVYIFNGGKISSTGAAKINVTGQGSTTGSTYNSGVSIDGSNSQITSATGDITLDGTGGGSSYGNYGVTVENGGKISSTGAAKINVIGQGGTTGTSNNHGVHVNGTNSQITSVTGDMTIDGTGDGSGIGNYGVAVFNGGQISSTDIAKIDITGQGSTTGTNTNHGVSVYGSTSYITSANGDMSIQGTGGGTGYSNYGVSIQSAGQINSTGTAQINVTGQGSTTGTNDNYGIYVLGIGSQIASATGDMTIEGTGGGTGNNNHGLSLASYGAIGSIGAAKINVTGRGSTTGGDPNNGVLMQSHSHITSLNGNISVEGIGGGSDGNNHGLHMMSGSTIISVGAATINVIGQGSTTGTNNNQGIAINGTSTKITSVTGDITLNGTGGGTDYSNQGVLLNENGTVSSTGTAKINVTGQGSTTGTYYNHGIHVDNYGSQITSLNGDIALNGTGGGTNTQNYGVYISQAGAIASTGTAKIDVAGQGSTTGTTSNHGVYLAGTDWIVGTSGTITSATGDITIQGTGGGISSGNYGVALVNGSKISSTGVAKIDITGQGSTTGSGGSNTGILLSGSDWYGSSSQITSATGDITIAGTGGGTGASSYGVSLASTGQISSTGIAKINVTGQGSTTGTHYNRGIQVTGTNSKITSANGDMTLSGTGGGSGETNVGVWLESGGQISSTGAAKIDITGQGSTTGTDTNHGIHLSAANSTVTSVNGGITLSGTGGGSGESNLGVLLESGGQISSTGAAEIDMTAQGGTTGTNFNHGLYVYDSTSYVTSATGDMTINATGGGSGERNFGVYVSNGGQINSTGSAKLDITGQGSTAGTDNNYGVFLYSGANITGLSGDITVNGTGGGTTTANYGIALSQSGFISSTGAANITLTGIKGAGTSGYGLYSSLGASLLGSNSMTGNLTLVTDTYSLSNLQMRTGGILTLKPYTDSTSIGINGGAGDLSATNFLSVLDASTVSPSKVIIGNSSAGTGAVTIGNGWNLSSLNSPVEVYGGSITTGGISTRSSLLLAARSTDINVDAGSTFAKTTGADSTLELRAARSILFNGTGGSPISVSSSSNKLNVILNADTDQGSDAGEGGAISLANTNMTTNGGNITLGGGANPATTAAIGTSSNAAGIALETSVLNAGAGNILLRGQGYDNAAANQQYGVYLHSDSQLQTTSGTIGIHGVGVDGTDSNHGVYLTGANSQITSATGDMSIHGTGGGDMMNYGVLLGGGAQIRSTGAAKIDVTGQGSATGSMMNVGVTLDGIDTQISSADGDITIDGTGDSPSFSNYGVWLSNGAAIRSTGNAKIHVTGQGSTAGTQGNYGVFIEDGDSQITSVTGDITIEGTGGGSGEDNNGIVLLDNGKISSTGNAKINVTGQSSSSGTGSSSGIYMKDYLSEISSLDGDITIEGLARGSGEHNRGIYIQGSAQVSSTGAAKINVTGQGSASSTKDDVGIMLDAAGTITSATGDMTLQGTSHGTGESNSGVYLESGAYIHSTGTAKVDITGQTSASGTQFNAGVRIGSSASQITSVDGDITIEGTANGSNQGNMGISNEGDIISTGNAKINLTGQGSTTGTQLNYGFLNSGNIASVTGDMTIEGTGGGNVNANHGIILSPGGQISSTGSAKINMTGQASTIGTNDNYGIVVDGVNSKVTSANGDMTIDGTGGGTGTNNIGVLVYNTGAISSTGNAKLNITGQGSTSGTDTNHGVYVNGTSSAITSATGDITIDGTGGGTGAENFGVYVSDAGVISSTDTAKIDITGQGSTAGTNNNHGIYVISTNSKITSANGDITIDGTGGGTGLGNVGVAVLNAGIISSTGTAKIDIVGQGGSGVNNNHGVYVFNTNSKITSTTGDMTIEGIGGGTGNANHGLFLETDGEMSSTGAAKLTLTGIKGSGATAYGLFSSNGTNRLGNNSMTGGLTLISDTYSLSDLQIRTGGILTLKPYTTATTIGINGGAGDFSPAPFLAVLDTSTVSPSKLVIGDSVAGTGTVTIGDGWDFSAEPWPVEVYGGSISTGSITTGANSLLMQALSSDLTLRSGSVINSTAANDAVILVAKEKFLNESDNTALNVTGGGRWLVYAANSKTSQEGGLEASKLYKNTYANNPPNTIAAGNYFIYANAVSQPANQVFTIPVPYLLSPIQSPNTVIPGQFYTSQAQFNQALSGQQTIASNLNSILTNHGPSDPDSDLPNINVPHQENEEPETD